MSLTATLCSTARSARLRGGSERRSSGWPPVSRRKETPRTDRPGPTATESFEPTSDEDLLRRYRDARRPEDFAELFRRYSGELSRYLARYLGDAALAEDVLQDTFLLVHAKCGLYQDGWPSRPWLYAVALHRAVDALRRFRRLPRLRLDPPHAADEPGSLLELLAGDGPGPLEELQERERQEWVRESVARLPEPLRQALVLTYYQGLSYAEVADLLAVPLGTVKSRLHGAIARMRAMAQRSGRP
jgi:RNA polymerase sigma-70 factor (ECF subfamily)